MPKQINLAPLTDNGRVHNLAGKAKGQDARAALQIPALDGDQEPVDVLVPDELYAISPSFFLGMFSQSLTKLGTREAFLSHYMFRADDVIMAQIEDGIRKHFTTATALTE